MTTPARSFLSFLSARRHTVLRISPILYRPVLAPQRYYSDSPKSTPQYQPPTPPPQNSAEAQKSNPHREFYYHFGSPILKVFLGALFTYELLLYGWLKLESVELAAQNNEKVKALEDELKELMEKKR